jgi:hypothetical protein
MSSDLPNPLAAVPLRLSLDRAWRGALSDAMQRGVAVPARVPCPVADFLTGQLGIESSYVERRISTMFLDGEVVDSAETATLRHGSSLALSAALPGLAGAALRRGGAYAAMRSSITHGDDASAPDSAASPGVVRVKLFNLLLEELSGVLLRHGILLAHDQARPLLDALGERAPLTDGAPVLLTITDR